MSFRVTPLAIPEVLLVEPDIFGDARGFFVELYHADRYAQHGIGATFVQDNLSRSQQGVLRGLHAQSPNPQGKLVCAVEGTVFDVAVDIRAGSPTFGKWVGAELSDVNKHQLYIPPGFAHGFLVLSPTALFAYKCTALYSREGDFSVRWNDPTIGIEWPLSGDPILSDKDRTAPLLSEIDRGKLQFQLP